MGILHDSAEVTIFQDRALNGYNPNGIFSSSTELWDDLKARADELMNDNFVDLYDSSDMTSTYGDAAETIQTNKYGHYTRDCAFYYLIKGDASYGAKAKASILAQVRNYNPHFEDYYSMARSSMSNLFHFGGVATRFLLAFDYCKDLFIASEITEVEDWFDRLLPLCLQHSEYYPRSNFPQRLDRLYPNSIAEPPAYNAGTTYSIGDEVLYGTAAWWQSLADTNLGNTPVEGVSWTRVAGNYAASAQLSHTNPLDAEGWTHKDTNGDFQNKIYRLHTDWQNQDSLMMLVYSLYSVYKNNAANIDRAKIFFEEYLKYAIFPDGMSGENGRNGETQVAKGTMWYCVISAECYMYFMEALRRINDRSMVDYTTTEGLWGTEGVTKNIKSVFDTLMSNISQSTVRYYNTVADANKLDVLDGTAYRWRPELPYGVLNLSFNLTAFKDTYLLNNATENYNDFTGGPRYVADGDNINNVGVIPIVPYYYETEIDDYTPRKQGARALLF